MRIYCPRANITGNRIIILDPGQIHHLSSVKRLKKGDRVVVFDGESQEYECVIDDIAKDKVELLVLRLRSGLMVSVAEPSVVRAGKAVSIKLDLT
ncbi:MAG: RNA methyltransferase PUA domain-containing protein, partial [Candidatus Omnitrophota bacterium]